jgi:hypothetical protein
MLRFGPEYRPEGTRPLGSNEACRVTAHGRVPEGRIFRSEPHTYVRYFFLHILPYYFIFKNVTSISYMFISSITIFLQ